MRRGKLYSVAQGLVISLGALLIVVVSPQATAQAPQLFGRNVSDIQSQLNNSGLWASLSGEPGLADCSDAFEKTRPMNKGRRPASERHRAAVTYQQCLTSLKALVGAEIAASGTANDFTSMQLAFTAAETAANNDEEESDAEQTFMGIRFGVGIGASFASHKRISDAEVAANGTVRAKKIQSAEPRVILESHYYGFCNSAKCNTGEAGHGLFFGIVAKDDKLISAVAAGFMFGWKDKRTKESAGFSIGIGAILDSDVTDLAKGFKEGKALPAGETEVKFTSKSRPSAILFFTRTF